MSRFPDFTSFFDTHTPKNCPNRFCRVHYFFNFQSDRHEPFPFEWSFLSSIRGWVTSTVRCGPGAWLPKKPTPDHLTDMQRHCPHPQMDMTCDYCLRHTFHPLET